jgi:hypothetical protein
MMICFKQSLRDVGSPLPLVILTPDTLSPISNLSEIVDPINHTHVVALPLWNKLSPSTFRQQLSIQALTQIPITICEQALWIDSNSLVLQNIDFIFTYISHFASSISFGGVPAGSEGQHCGHWAFPDMSVALFTHKDMDFENFARERVINGATISTSLNDTFALQEESIHGMDGEDTSSNGLWLGDVGSLLISHFHTDRSWRRLAMC